MDSKGSLVLSIVLTVLVMGLVGYMIYDKVAKPEVKCNVGETTKEGENKNVADNNEVVKTYSYSSIKGAYKSQSTIDVGCGEDATGVKGYSMNLYDNGLFEIYENHGCSSVHVLGNYIIEGNKVILNTLFHRDNINGDANTRGSYTFEINSDGSLSGTYNNNKEIFVNDPNGKLSSSGSPFIAEAGNYTLVLKDESY